MAIAAPVGSLGNKAWNWAEFTGVPMAGAAACWFGAGNARFGSSPISNLAFSPSTVNVEFLHCTF